MFKIAGKDHCSSNPGWNPGSDRSSDPGSDPSSNPGSKFRYPQLFTVKTVVNGIDSSQNHVWTKFTFIKSGGFYTLGNMVAKK